MKTGLVGTGTVFKALWRNEWRSLLIWMIILILIVAGSPLVYERTFDTVEERQALAGTISGNPALGIIFGTGFDLTTVDGFTLWRGLSLGCLLIAMGISFCVTKMTRGQEDSGQAEILAAGVMGRSARLMAALIFAYVGSLAISIVVAVIAGLLGLSWDVALLLGLVFTFTGWIFGSWAAVSSQVAADAHTANSMALGVLGFLFLARGSLEVLDAPQWILDINSLHWPYNLDIVGKQYWGWLVLSVLVAFVLAAFSFYLQAKRDFGQGSIAQQPGPEEGKIANLWHFQYRLHASFSIVWIALFILLGIVFGYMATSVESLLGGGGDIAQMFASEGAAISEMSKAFVHTIVMLASMLAAAAGVQICNRMLAEEREYRIEPVLAAPITRWQMYRSIIGAALLLATLLAVLAGGLIITFAAQADIGIDYSDGWAQVLLTLPAVWTVVGLAACFMGGLPRFGLLSWLGIVISFGITILGPTFNLSDTAMAISPFYHVPVVGADDGSYVGIIVVTAIAGIFIAAGALGYRKRDIA